MAGATPDCEAARYGNPVTHLVMWLVLLSSGDHYADSPTESHSSLFIAA